MRVRVGERGKVAGTGSSDRHVISITRRIGLQSACRSGWPTSSTHGTFCTGRRLGPSKDLPMPSTGGTLRESHAINKMPTPEKRPRKLKGREAIAEERFRELVAWYTLQGMDEATARERARATSRPG